MSYRDHFTSHVRLTLLRILAEAPTYRANSSILHGAVEEMGFTCTRDQVRTELAWLSDQGLVTSSEAAPGLIVATSTERGLDVASGRATVPGIVRPSPRG